MSAKTALIKWMIKQRAARTVFAKILLAAFRALAKKVKIKLKMQRLLWTSKQNHLVVSEYRHFLGKVSSEF
jgi:hypothetical protein